MNSLIELIYVPVAIILFLCLASINIWGQADSIESLTEAVGKNSSNAESYLKRGDFYADLWSANETNENLAAIARAAADYSTYLKLKPRDAQVYRRRAAARNALFLSVNPFAIADLQQSIRFNPKDLEARDELRVQQAEYRKSYRTKECVEARKTIGFQGHPSDEPLTYLAEYLDAEMTETTAKALKAIACGANVNYVYQRSRRPEFANFDYYRIEHLIAMLEAGADVNGRDKSGNTPLMQTLESIVRLQSKIDGVMIERVRIAVQYGANLRAVNLKEQNVVFFARKTKNSELMNLLKIAGAK